MTLTNFIDYAEKHYNQINLISEALLKPHYYINAFTNPLHPVVIRQENEEILTLLQWGLIPAWTPNKTKAEELKLMTLNARAETLLEKPSFKESFKKRRCLIPADGFFEWREYNGKKYPYYITLKSKRTFSFAGIWDLWTDPETGEEIKTFSLITTEANKIMEQIHNTKKRMPVILNCENEKEWMLLGNKELLRPYDENDMTAYTISKDITKKGIDLDSPEIIRQFDYEELPEFNP